MTRKANRVYPPAEAEHQPLAWASGVNQIRVRAYELYESRVQGGQPGDELADWLEAEREVRGQGGSLVTPPVRDIDTTDRAYSPARDPISIT